MNPTEKEEREKERDHEIPRPPTPQALLHRLPDKPDWTHPPRPSRYLILLMASTAVAGKVQIASSLARHLSCPLFQGDTVHESSAKASSSTTTTATRSGIRVTGGAEGERGGMWGDETRYRRMWLFKMMRTGLLFPEESRPANEGFKGFGWASSSSSSTTTSPPSSSAPSGPLSSSTRSGSTRSTFSALSGSSIPSGRHRVSVVGSEFPPVVGNRSTTMTQNKVHGISTSPKDMSFTLSETEQARRTNPALMVVTHPQLEKWHRTAIREALGDYGLGVIFIPLWQERQQEEDEEEELPILQPLNPATMTAFPIPPSQKHEEITVTVDVKCDVDMQTAQVIREVDKILAREGETG